MTYLLDTDTCIAFLRGRDLTLRRRFAARSANEIVIPAPVRGELFYGAARSQNPLRDRQAVDAFLTSFSSLPFADDGETATRKVVFSETLFGEEYPLLAY